MPAALGRNAHRLQPRRPPASRRRTRGRAGLGQDAIVRAAVRLADARGVEGLVMRRVAAELGAGVMSLYRHVSSRDELLDLLLEQVWGEIDVPAQPSGDWRRDLSSLARATRAMLRRHPWAATLLTSRPPFGPRYLAWFEFSLATLGRRGVEPGRAVAAIGSLYAYVAGAAGYEAGDARARSRHGLSDEQMRTIARSTLEPLLAAGRFPNLARFVEEGGGEPGDSGFEFGLECVLAGLEQKLPELRRRR